MAKRRCDMWLSIGMCALLWGCDPQPAGPDPALEADPPPTEDGRNPGAGNTDFDRGVAYIQKEAYAEAIPHFDRALSAQPDNAEAEYYRALAYHKTGAREKAEKGYQRALQLNGELVLARLHLGALYLEEPPNPQKAIEVLEPATQKEPNAVDIREQLAFAYRLAGKNDQALSQYDTALKIKDNPEVRLAYADLLFELGKEDQAVTQMKKLVQHYKKDVEKLAFLAHRFGKSKAFDECVKTFDMAVALKPNEAAFYLHRGICKHELKDEPGARGDFDKALSVNAKFQPAHYYLGKSYALDKKARGKAVDHYQKAIAIDKDSAVGKKAQQELNELVGAAKR